jgi:hypothetical protein
LYEVLEDSYAEIAELNGYESKFFLYKVPQLDYKTEDITVTFKLVTMSGETPAMKAKFIKTDIEKVTLNKDGLMDEVIAPSYTYKNAT